MLATSAANGVTSSSIPLHCGGETRINVGTSFGHKAHFQAASLAHKVNMAIQFAQFADVFLRFRVHMRTAGHNLDSNMVEQSLLRQGIEGKRFSSLGDGDIKVVQIYPSMLTVNSPFRFMNSFVPSKGSTIQRRCKSSRSSYGI